MRQLIYLLLFSTLLFGADTKVLVQQEGSFIIVDKSTNTSFGTSSTGGTSTPASSAGEQALPTTPFNVLDYGLKGDGNTDDSSALMTLAQNSEVTNWYFPAGKSFLLSNIIVPSHVKAIYGGATIISKAYSVGSTDSPFGAFRIGAATDVNGLIIDGLGFIQQNSSNWPVENLSTRWYGHITVSSSYDISDLEIRNCTFDTSRFQFNGIKVFGTKSGHVNSGLHIHHNTFTNVDHFGIEVFGKGTQEHTLVGMKIHDNVFTGVSGGGRAVSIVGIAGGVGLTGVKDGSEHYIYDNTFTNTTWGMEIGNCTGIYVSGNTMHNVTEDLLSNASSLKGTNFYYNNHFGGTGTGARLNLYQGGGHDEFYNNYIGCQILMDSRGHSQGYDYYFHDNTIVEDVGSTPMNSVIKLVGVHKSRFINNNIYGSLGVDRGIYLTSDSGGTDIVITGNSINLAKSSAIGIHNLGSTINESLNTLITDFKGSLPTQ